MPIATTAKSPTQSILLRFNRLVRDALPRVGIRYWRKSFRGRDVYLPLRGAAFGADAVFFSESAYLERLLGVIKENDVVVDVGAHHGLFTIVAARLASQVVAFEPDEDNRRELRANLDRNGIDNVKVVPVALAADVGLHPIWRGGHETVLIAKNKPKEIRERAELAATLSLAATGLRPDVVKIDVEGFEDEVVLGAGPALEHCRCVGVEIHPPNLTGKGSSVQVVFDELQRLGFSPAETFYGATRHGDPQSRHNVVFERSGSTAP